MNLKMWFKPFQLFNEQSQPQKNWAQVSVAQLKIYGISLQAQVLLAYQKGFFSMESVFDSTKWITGRTASE